MKKMLNKLLLLGLTLTLSVNAFSFQLKKEDYKDLHTEINNGNKINYAYDAPYEYVFGYKDRICILNTPWTTPDMYQKQKNRLIEVEKLLPKMHEKIFNGENVKYKEFLGNEEFKIITKNLDKFYEKAGCERRYTSSLLKRFLKVFKNYLDKNKKALLIIKKNTEVEKLKKSIDKIVAGDEERWFQYKNNIDFLLKITKDFEIRNKINTDYE